MKCKWEVPERKKVRVTVDAPNGTTLKKGDIVYIVRSFAEPFDRPHYHVADGPWTEDAYSVAEDFLEEIQTHEPFMDLEANCKPPSSK